MAPKSKSRHASATKVKTPLTELSDALNANASMIGRRAAVVAASGGLLVGLGMPAAADTQASVDTDSSSSDAPEFVANQALTVSATGDKQDKVAVVGATGVSATAAPKATPKPSADSSEAADSGNAADSGSADKDSAKKESKGAGDYPDAPSGSIVEIAKQYVGVPYVSGGKTPTGWDCSGFTSYVYKKAGKNIPSQSAAQRAAGTVVSKSEARPGDLIYRPGHIGIYLGGDKMIDAGNPRVDTTIRSYSWMGSVVFLRF